jgi:hypothetical protein
VQNKYSQEELQLMKTQDVKYLALKERVDAEVRRAREGKGYQETGQRQQL